MGTLLEVAEGLNHARGPGQDPSFQQELDYYFSRTTLAAHLPPTAPASPSTAVVPRSYLKREDLAHTGSHKLNSALGQAGCLLAKRMGRTKLIAETVAGQHGVATATVAALFGMGCEVTWEEDVRRQALNVYRMKLLGATVVPVHLREPHPQGRSTKPSAVWIHRPGGGLSLRHRRRATPVPDDGARLSVRHRL